MKHSTVDQANGAITGRVKSNFGLTDRALAFARIFAENPRLGTTQAAIKAGYAHRCARGAHVRAYELTHSSNVVRAILYFSTRYLTNAMAEARLNLSRLAIKEGQYWNRWDHRAVERLTAKLDSLEAHIERLEKIYENAL